MRCPTFRQVASLGLALVALAACSGDDPPQGMTADMRLLHADPAQGPIDVEVGGSTVIQGVTYGHASPVTEVPGGAQHIVLRSGNQMIVELDETMSEQVINSLMVTAAGVQFADEVVPDTGAVAGNRANIRMVNVVGTNTSEPNVLDVKVRAPAPDTVMTFGVDTRVARYGTLMYFDPGEFTFRFLPAGGSTLLTEVTFTVAQGETKAVVLERADDGTYSAGVVIEE